MITVLYHKAVRSKVQRTDCDGIRKGLGHVVVVTVAHYLVIDIILTYILLRFNVGEPLAVVYLIHYGSVICASERIVERLLGTVVEDICVIHHGCYERSNSLFDGPCDFLRRQIGGFLIVPSDLGAEPDF